MKKLALLTLCFNLFSSASFALSGSSGTRGGGNVTAAEFSAIAESVLGQVISQRSLNVLGLQLDGVRMEKKFESTKVFVSTSALTLNGNVTQAINDPSANTIEIDATAWQSLNATSREHLVIHELFGLTVTEVSDLNYNYSNALFNLLAPNAGLQVKNDFKCEGTEPFWSSEVTSQSASFEVDKIKWAFPKVTLNTAAGTESSMLITVQATNGKDNLSGFINRTYDTSGHTTYGCSDGMSNLLYPFSFQLFVNGQAYTGCCEDADHSARPDDSQQ